MEPKYNRFMAAKKPQQTIGDYVTMALSPLLIMAMVGSLVFFLLEVLYVGQYEGQLQWTLFFFVFAMVLIARISIEMPDGRAGLYGIALGVVVYIALMRFVAATDASSVIARNGIIMLIIMGVIWWSAHRLTWDCTYIDETVDASGKGVLDAAGLGQPSDENDLSEPLDTDKEIAGRSPLLGWWDRYRDYQERQKHKPHTPGVWVVYFSLAALPLFGLGQALIPANETSRRNYAFWLMVIYVGSGLGMLVTTSYLGLRRYLRQRKLKMPVAMTGAWLAIGAVLIVAMLAAGAVLPRPYGEYQIVNITPLGSKERDASKYAVKRSGSGKGQGNASKDKPRDDQKGESGKGTKSDDKEGGGGSKSPTKTKASGQGKSQSKGKGDQKGDGKSQNQSDSSKSSEKNQEKSDDTTKGEESKDKDDGSSDSTSADEKSSPVSNLLEKLGPLGKVLKWIVFILLGLMVLFFILKSGLQYLANFTEWARRLLNALQAWWQGLFGGRQTETADESDKEATERVIKPRPFAVYSNPFLDGRDGQLSPEELARYSFDAFQSWAWENDTGRDPEETPLEFAQRLGEEYPDIEADARGLAGLYARVIYAKAKLAPSSLETLKRFWQRLDRLESQPAGRARE